MRILSVSVVFPPAWQHGGTPITAHAVAKAMIHQGHDVLAICTGDEKDSSTALDIETTWDGVPVIYCSRETSPIPFYSPSLRDEVVSRVGSYDVATIRSSWTYIGPAASNACLRKEVPYLAYPEGNFDPWCLKRGRLKKAVFWQLLDKPFFRKAAAIVALTKSEAESVRQMGLTNRVEVIPNGVDVSDFERGSSREELESEFPRMRNRILVLFMGRIHPKKGLPGLVTAFDRVNAEYPNALLVVAGPDEGGHRTKVEQQVRERELEESVLFTGPVFGDKKVGLLRSSDIFVLPSHSEGLPIVVLEALACGLPVVLTDKCNVPQVARAGAGIETSTSPYRIAEALRDLLSDDLARLQMGKNAYQLAVKRFSWRRIARLTADLCSDIV